MRKPPKLIVSLPGRDVPSVREEAQRAKAAGADIAELRLDRWPVETLERLPQLFPSPIPLLATLRSRAEGGEGPDDELTRARWIERASELPFELVDLELRRDSRRRSLEASRSVLSVHLPSAHPVEAWAPLLERASAGEAFVKVVFPATLEELATEVLPRLPVHRNGPFVLHTTGASGPLLRAWGMRLGLAAVYAQLPRTPPGSRRSAPPVESAQIPVDHLHHYFRHGGEGPLQVLLGHPVAHSFSPAIHANWIRQLDRSGLYIALDVATPAEFDHALRLLEERGANGVNVTHPWKQLALSLSDSASASARTVGAANTLRFENGRRLAENTDVQAVSRRIRELREDGSWDGRSLTVIGTGASASATLFAAKELGIEAVVAGRNPAAANALAARYGAKTWESSAPSPASLLVHATPVGREQERSLDVNLAPLLSRSTYLLDFVYRPADPVLARAAAAAGARYEDGYRLLVYQAARSFELFWGRPLDASLEHRQLEEPPCAA
ncbi:MAG: type I 3-dehydroquinate dehydratase [Thermoplasmata archaeon]|nr:type I 3-dehydroquinate dehydratase [Thermoplasmata archaeon]